MIVYGQDWGIYFGWIIVNGLIWRDLDGMRKKIKITSLRIASKSLDKAESLA